MNLEFSSIYSKLGDGEIIDFKHVCENLSNVDVEDFHIIENIENLIKQGNYEDAKYFLNNSNLKGKILSNEMITMLFEEIYNTQLLALADHQDIFKTVDTIPVCKLGDVWISQLKELN